MALPPAFLDELRARTPLAPLIGRRVRLARSGRQWKGCCPFHGEKTPSFYVYDDHFHCFGCGAHGDAIGFVMQGDGAGFMEAVERLAAEAGMEVPRPTPAAAEAERRRMDLAGALASAAEYYRSRLFLPEGARALAYLRGRGLTDETIRRFGLGWSGEGRGGLAASLANDGAEPPLLAEAGLLRVAEDGAPAGELFFNRVMFPIRDRRGRVISFGARTLGDGQPKYLNGPETPLFSKRRTLYGLDFAREAAKGGARVLAVEGYMDVIALHQAGFGGAVAPLGTALTEEQLAELWRLSPLPALCFDGDAAGARAAARAAELALPALTAEQSLALVTLPAGEDPDSLVRHGPDRFAALLDGAVPLAEGLFGLVCAAVGDASEELRARLSHRLEALADSIRDKPLAWEYRATFRRLFRERYRAPSQGRRGTVPAPRARPEALRPPPPPAAVAAERARVLLAILLRHPGLVHDVEEALGGLDLPPPLAALRTGLVGWSETADVLDSAALLAHLTATGLRTEVAQVLAHMPFPLPACADEAAMPAEAEAGWWHIFGLMHRGRLEQEVEAARRDFAARMDEAAQRRLIALRTAYEALHAGAQPLENDA